MKYIQFLQILFSCALTLAFSCDKPEKMYAPQESYYNSINVKRWRDEYLDLDSTYLNGILPLNTTKAYLYKILGKPDKILMDCLIQENFLGVMKKNKLVFEHLIYRHSSFESQGEDVIIRMVDFEEDSVELINSKIRLNNRIRPIDIQRVFPESGKLINGTGNMWSGYITVRSSNKGNGDGVWFLIFRSGQLRRVVLYHPQVYE